VTSIPEIETDNFASRRWTLCPPSSVTAVSWNIDRGLKLQGVIEFLSRARADIILLQEADLNARRTHHLNIAREISQKLQLNYVFGREFQELSQGTGTSPAFHGQATLSRWPLTNPRIIRFQKQSNFWRPHWFIPEIDPFQERLGGRMALVSEVSIAGRTIITYNLHLESKGDDQLRESQLAEALRDARQYSAATPVLLAGDFNLDASGGNTATAMRQSQFQDAFSNHHAATTRNTFLEDGRAIDWMFSRGPVRPEQPQVHRSVTASDHYPLSITLHFV
jgi:endonuclease/exonuclease/phosphatase family metal-dependent hydrolase